MHPLEQQNDDFGSLTASLYSEPVSALPPGSLLQLDSNEDSEEEDAKLDRISDLLSSLIQEANEAVSQNDARSASPKPVGSIPMVRKLSSSSSSEQRQHQKRRVSRVPVRPLSYPSTLKRSAALSTNSYNPISSNHTAHHQKHNHPTTPIHTQRLSSSSSSSYMIQTQKQGATEDVLMESFKRLDTSLAMIDSLSRDLAPPETDRMESADQRISFVSASSFNQNQINTIVTIANNKKNSLSFDSRLSVLLLLPLLHVPHALISIAFESVSNSDYHVPNNSLGGVFVWAILFAITNLVVDKALVSPISTHHTSPSKKHPNTRNEQKESLGTLVPSMRMNTTSIRTRRRSVNNKRVITHRRKYSFHQKQLKTIHDSTRLSVLPLQSPSFTSLEFPNHTFASQPNLSRRYSI
ncbi:hypothetical protein BD560DRAFT_493886 [Blakeslea trispora]|nr:hypothetical protein BD560DRAFT_493886 [Blakeslea trispora]